MCCPRIGGLSNWMSGTWVGIWVLPVVDGLRLSCKGSSDHLSFGSDLCSSGSSG